MIDFIKISITICFVYAVNGTEPLVSMVNEPEFAGSNCRYWTVSV